MSFPAVRREMVFSAAPHVVYRAWLTPELLQRWMAPGSAECSRAEVDERVGGRFRIWHTDAGRPAGGFEAEILELVPDRRIAWRWGFVGPDRQVAYDSTLTVTLDETPEGGTRLSLLHERLDDLAAALPQVAAQVSAGWEGVLHQLAVLIKAH
jgi:uncharacterized protein YndB with AHSA1/START domain